jgi:signal transduction histidine kinase
VNKLVAEDPPMRAGSYWELLGRSVLAWMLAAAVMYAQNIARSLYWNDPYPFRDGMLWALGGIVSALLTPFIIRAAQRWPVEFNSFRHVGRHVLLSVAFGLARAGVECFILMPLQVPEIFGPRPAWATSMINIFAVLSLYDLVSGAVAYWIIVSIQATKQYQSRFQERTRQAMQLELHASELRAQVVQAQLSALKTQLQPHFLFNTLNAIVVLVRQEKELLAEEALTRLSDLLRAVLADMEVQEVPLSRELAYLQLYLAIEQMRFPDRLQVRIDVDPSILNASVPHMALQPLVENAVRHGIAPQAQGGTIVIKGNLKGERVHLIVKDDGAGFSGSHCATGYGLGLSNLRSRLEQLYAAGARLIVHECERGASVSITLPYRVHCDGQQTASIGAFAGETGPLVWAAQMQPSYGNAGRAS